MKLIPTLTILKANSLQDTNFMKGNSVKYLSSPCFRLSFKAFNFLAKDKTGETHKLIAKLPIFNNSKLMHCMHSKPHVLQPERTSPSPNPSPTTVKRNDQKVV